MATSAFKSTTRRSALGGGADDTGSSNRTGIYRRSRSLSRYSGRVPPPPPADPDEFPETPRGRFVNTVRGSSGFPEISLDDLANEFFPPQDVEEELEQGKVGGRTGRRLSDVRSSQMETEASRSRGRSVSRKGSFDNNAGRKGVPEGSARRRSVSVARYRCSDSESDIDLSHNFSNLTKLKTLENGNRLQHSSHKPTTSNRGLRRSLSQKDLIPLQDSHSSQSSTLTDDEARDARTSKGGAEKTIRVVYAQKKTEHPIGDGEGTGLYEAMRKEVRHAVEVIRTELEKVMVKTKPSITNDGDEFQSKGSEVIQAIAEIRRNYTTKLEESEKRKQDLLSELAAEEQRGQELSKIVKELLPEPKQNAKPERPFRFRRRSNDRTRMSKCLTVEAEKYFEDFISNVEDTDISSFDGEKSDASSTIGGSTKSGDPVIHSAMAETRGCLEKCVSLPAETDGVVLPWLEWDASNDSSPLLCKSKMKLPPVSGTNLFDTAQEASAMHDDSNCFTSSRGSWSPDCNLSSSSISKDKMSGGIGEVGNYLSKYSRSRMRESSFDMDEYIHLQHSEALLFESLRQRQRIESGSLVLCRINFT